MTTILTKIKHKGILFEKIQVYASTRHYILPYLISQDKKCQEQLKIFNGILKNNDLSSNFMKGLFSFISDRILFRIVNEEKNILNDAQYLPEDEEKNKFQILKKRILAIYKSGKHYNETNISINELKKHLPNDKEFALFLFDFLENKKQILSIFNDYNLEEKNDPNKFLSYYEKNKILFENKEKINQISDEEVEIFYNKMNRKVLINLAFIGNKGSGKSTTIGHLLYNTGNVIQNSFINIINKTREYGIPSYKFSWIVNTTKQERESCQSIIYKIKKFETKKYDFNLIDLPGNFRYRKNIIKGLSFADAVVIVLSANETDKNDHIKDYLIIIYTMGIRQIIIAINKMDETKDSKDSEKLFLKIKKNIIDLCEKIGFDIDKIQFIPYSGFTGQNLVNEFEDGDDNKNIIKINKMEWYKGKTLIESFDELKPPKRKFDGPLQISALKVEKITGIGPVLVGKILSGKLLLHSLLYMPFEGFTVECITIEIHHKFMNETVAGDIVGMHLFEGTVHELGMSNLIFEKDNMNLDKNIDNLRVKILMINKRVHLRIGSVFTLFCYNVNVPVKITKIEYIIDEANKILEKEPKEIDFGQRAIIIITLIKKKAFWNRHYYFYSLEKYINNALLGSFSLFNGEFVAVGNIKDINIL